MSKSRSGRNYKIFISNIPYTSGYQEVHDLFSKFGPIKNCVLPSKRGPKGTREPSGTSIVTFYNEASMIRTLSEDSKIILGGRHLRVEVTLPKNSSKIGPVSLSPFNSDITPPLKQINIKFRQNENQHISTLPLSVWIQVLHFLDLSSLCLLEGTCRVFYCLCREYWSVKKSLSFHNVFSLWHFKSTVGLTSELLAVFLSRTGPALLSLDLSASSRFLTPGCLDIIAYYAPQLTTLDITGVRLALEPVQSYFPCCTGLRYLCMSGCYGLSEKLLWRIIECRRDLISLNISESKRVTGNCLRMLSGSLQHFNGSNCSRLSVQGVRSLCAQSPGLLSLNLSQCYSLTPHVLQDISTCSKLRSLDFPRNVVTQDSMVTQIHLSGLSKITSLQFLDLSHQHMLSDPFLYALASRATQLTSLKIPGCHQVTDIGISHLKESHQLSTLDISYLHLVTDKGLLSLQLNLHSFTARMCPGITHIGVSSIVENSTSLLHIDLSSCGQVSSNCFPSLLAHLSDHKPSNPQSLHWAFGGTDVTQEDHQAFFEDSGVKLTLIDSSNISFAHSLNTEMFLPPPPDDIYPDVEPEPLHLSTDPESIMSPVAEPGYPLSNPVPAPDRAGFTLTCEENWDDDCAPNYFFDQTDDTSLMLSQLNTDLLCTLESNLDEDSGEGDATNFLTSDDVIYSQDVWELS